MGKRHRIAVLMGGMSNEREVSLKSGKAVAEALQSRGHDVIPVDLTEPSVGCVESLAPDMVFIALHGEFGEDGQVQRLLERKGIPYTASGPEASRLGMDKVAAKRVFIRNAVPTSDYVVVEPDAGPQQAAASAGSLGYPLVCKPAAGGSSLGVAILRSAPELVRHFARTFRDHARQASRGGRLPTIVHPPRHGARLLLERYAPGRELTVGMLDGEPLPVIEIRHRRELFDYEAKYRDSSTRYILPAPMLESLYRKVQRVSARAYESLGCRHFARVDLILGSDGNLYVLEVNTIPGFTPRSLVPMAARHAGIGFAHLCERIVHMALRDAARVASSGPLPQRRTA